MWMSGRKIFEGMECLCGFVGSKSWGCIEIETCGIVEGRI